MQNVTRAVPKIMSLHCFCLSANVKIIRLALPFKVLCIDLNTPFKPGNPLFKAISYFSIRGIHQTLINRRSKGISLIVSLSR